MKYTLFLFLFLFVTGCSAKKDYDLQQDPTVTEHFNKSQIKQLKKIVSFFDNEVRSLSKTNGSLNNSYQVFFKTLEDSALRGDIYGPILKIPTQKLNNLFSSLPDTVKNELWSTSRYISPVTKDSVADFDIRYGGQYEAFLKSSSKENKALANYYKTFKKGHGISPALIASFILRSNKLNMNRESQRLIVAVHYIAIKETGVLRKKYSILDSKRTKKKKKTKSKSNSHSKHAI